MNIEFVRPRHGPGLFLNPFADKRPGRMGHYRTFVILPASITPESSDVEIKETLDVTMFPFRQNLPEPVKQYISEETWREIQEIEEIVPDEGTTLGVDASGFYVVSSENYHSLYDYYMMGWNLEDDDCAENAIAEENRQRCKYLTSVTALLHFRDCAGRCIPDIIIDGRQPDPTPTLSTAQCCPLPFAMAKVLHTNASVQEKKALLLRCDPRLLIVVLDIHN